jgi:hypothetical protein
MAQQALSDIREALQAGDKQTARDLLEPILADQPDAEALTLAALAADSARDAVNYLRRALTIDPDHAEAGALLSRLEDLSGTIGGASAATAPESSPAPTEAPREIEPVGDSRLAQPERPQPAMAGDDDTPRPGGVRQVGQRRQEGDRDITVEGVYEMLWDCRYCGTQKLLGKTHRFCPNCGSPQDPSWRYYPSDDEKVAVQDHYYYGADVICPACSTANSAHNEFCGNCGSPLSEGAKVQAQRSRSSTAGGAFGTEDLAARQDAQRAAFNAGQIARQDMALPVSAEFAQVSVIDWLKRHPIVPAILVALVLLAGAAIYALTLTRESTAQVIDHRWEREIRIEQLTMASGSSSCNAVPGGAYNIDRRYEQVGSDRVRGEDRCYNRQVDQGDGTFRSERVCEPTYYEEPVYGYVCYYNYNTWQYERSAQSAGGLMQELAWPQLSLRAGSGLGAEREAGREERFFLDFAEEGQDDFSCPVNSDLFYNTALGDLFTIERGVVGGGVRCGTLQPALSPDE